MWFWGGLPQNNTSVCRSLRKGAIERAIDLLELRLWPTADLLRSTAQTSVYFSGVDPLLPVARGSYSELKSLNLSR